MAPLPRVALMSTGMAVGPPARPGAKGGYDPLANYATRTMRGDPAKDQMHSLLFPDRPNKPPDMAVPASQIDTYGTSLNHPFHHGGVNFDRAPDVTSRLHGARAVHRQREKYCACSEALHWTAICSREGICQGRGRECVRG